MTKDRFKFISYNGEYPNLCRGELLLYDNLKQKEIKIYELKSGGSISGDYLYVYSGPWIGFYGDENYSENEKALILKCINKNINYGCCGGCI